MSVRYVAVVITIIALGLVAGCGKAEPTVMPTSLPPTLTTAATSPATATPTTTATPTPTATVTPTETPTATSTKTPTCTPTPIPTATATPLPKSVLLEPMTHQWQTLNNCCPTSIAILLSYYGHEVSQHEVREHNWPLTKLRQYLSQFGLTARQYASPPPHGAVRQLLANGIPVVIGQRLSVDRDIGHCRVMRGYDDIACEFISDDPLYGPYHRIRYCLFAWFLGGDGETLIIYPPRQDALVESLMSELGALEQ